MNPTTFKLMMVAGEASGDMHAANLVSELSKMAPNISVEAMGGDALRRVGAHVLIDNRDLAVMGLIEIIRHYPKIRRALKKMEQHLRSNPPDLLVLVDYVEFNLRLAKTAKALGIKVLFYVSPQIWAWRPKRVVKIGRVIDMMATLFPFEVQYYTKHNIPARYVGHPLVGKVKASASRDELMQEFGLDASRPVLGLFPGSRRSEIAHILDAFLQTAALLLQTHPTLQIIIPLAPGLEATWLQTPIDRSQLGVTLLPVGRNYDAMLMADAILTASGTATLEITMMGTPLVIGHKISPLTYQIFKRLIRIPHVGLTNIVAGKQVVKEFLQDAAQPSAMAIELEPLLFNETARSAMKIELTRVTDKLGDREGSKVVAELALEMLEGKAP